MRGIKDQNLIKTARTLRKNLMPWENKLWYCLRDRRFKDYKFRRQYPIGNYIVDFCCITKKLIIELDGSGHIQRKIYDSIRDGFLRGKGFKVLRIWNNDLDNNLEGVLNKIYQMLRN